MAIFAGRGQGIDLVIDGNFIAKKMKILSKPDGIYLKRKLKTCSIQIHVEKV